ncbi:MAG: hypothetical protein LBK66_07500 [Spirochaetaceae bacterium]|jgi:hypothetical protein|nr:hypothetical protein [Spirochaetaceae bacterium]
MIRFIIFLYDALRFFIIVFLLLQARTQFDNFDNYFFSPVLCSAPFALFPLMSFFLWFDREKYNAFAQLYIAGKIVGVCAMFTIVFSSLREFMAAYLLLDLRRIAVNIIVPAIAVLDMLFLLPVIFSLKQTHTAPRN